MAKTTRDSVKKKLHSLGKDSVIQVGPYQWRKSTLGSQGVSATWERVDDPVHTKTTGNLIDLIIEMGPNKTKIVKRSGEVELRDKKPYSPRRTLAERTRDDAQARMNAIDTTLERLVARQETLIAEKKELSNLLASINKHCPVKAEEEA